MELEGRMNTSGRKWREGQGGLDDESHFYQLELSNNRSSVPHSGESSLSLEVFKTRVDVSSRRMSESESLKGELAEIDA